MIVHRILDVVFRTLDAVDAVRARVDSALGREPQPPSSWPPLVEPPSPAVDLEGARLVYEDTAARMPARADRGADGRGAAERPVPAPKKAAKKKAKATPAKTRKKAADDAAAGPSKGSRKKASDTRKGSVDRKGTDFDSPRARAIHTFLTDNGGAIVADDAALDGKKTLARVMWAVAAAEAAGSAQGLTAADASALLSTVAGLEVFSTNVARAFRDESTLFEETVPDGRSKRYKLTSAGRERLTEVATR
ncbi:MAG: hypothetical protein Q8O67_25400 [Deltaproteobacteria bacterium]|nr:hypothetical protein [Deltaproteobacteria bacterium]